MHVCVSYNTEEVPKYFPMAEPYNFTDMNTGIFLLEQLRINAHTYNNQTPSSR